MEDSVVVVPFQCELDEISGREKGVWEGGRVGLSQRMIDDALARSGTRWAVKRCEMQNEHERQQ